LTQIRHGDIAQYDYSWDAAKSTKKTAFPSLFQSNPPTYSSPAGVSLQNSVFAKKLEKLS